MRFPHGPGFGAFGGIIDSVIAGMFFLVCFAVVVGLLFVLVRFLLVATKAAEIYVAKNGAPAPVAPAATTATPVATAPSAASPATTTATKPAPTTPRTRTTKPPTT